MPGIGFELLGVIAVGIGAAAVLYASMHASRKAGFAPANWLLPAGIGLAMICYAIWNDYAWLVRAQDRLPEGAEVLLTGHDSYFWAPWTYVFPATIRFAALDPASISNSEGVKRAEIMLVERRGPTLIVPQEFDCKAGRVRPANGNWTDAQDDPAFAIVCNNGS